MSYWKTLLVVAVLYAQSDQRPKLESVTDEKFRIGDVWEYSAHTGEEESRLVILKIERSPTLGVIVHIAVDNLTWKTCDGRLVNQGVGHMPFAREALESSVVRRTGTRGLPDFKEGYKLWREAFEKDQAGIYTISVKEATEIAESTYRSGLGCPATK